MDLRCIHCGAIIDETDCIDLSLEGDYIIAEKVGESVNKHLCSRLFSV